jgi:hypothetical protein
MLQKKPLLYANVQQQHAFVVARKTVVKANENICLCELTKNQQGSSPGESCGKFIEKELQCAKRRV